MDLKKLRELISKHRDNLENEAQIKQSLVLPFLRELGFDPDDPTEVIPECVADVGNKKAEKVDYGLKVNGKLQILVECKCFFKKDRSGYWKEQNDYVAQLSRYFQAVNEAEFGILTDGIHYQFYADLSPNKGMDLIPFLEIDLEDVLEEEVIHFLEQFHKSRFDAKSLKTQAFALGRIQALQEHFKCIINGNLDDKIIEYFMDAIGEKRNKTDNTRQEYNSYLKKAIPAVITAYVVNQMSSGKGKEEEDDAEDNKIITTVDELQAFYIIRAMLSSEIDDIDRITYKDSSSYFSITIDNKSSKTICRLYLGERKKSINFTDDGWDSKTRVEFSSLNDLYQYKDRFASILKSLL